MTTELMQEIDALNAESLEIFNTDPDQALQLALKARAFAQQTKYESGEAEANRNCATACWMLSDNAQALTSAQAALNIFEKLQDAKGQIDVLSIFTAIYGSLADFEAALEYQLKALGIAEEQNYHNGLSKAYFNLGTIYSMMGQFEQALQYNLRCLQLDEKLGYQANLASTLSTIGDLYLKLGKVEEAQEYQQRALLIADQISSSYDLAYIYQNIGSLHQSLGQGLDALNYLERSLELYESLGNQSGASEALRNIGETESAEEDYTSALATLKRALKLSEEIGAKDQSYKIYESFSKVYEAIGDYNNSLKYYRLFAETRNEVLDSDRQKTIASMQLRFDIDKTEKEREILRLRNIELDTALQAVRRELEIGRQIQSNFLPEKLPVLPGWELDVRFQPAREVSGDYYDAFELGKMRAGLVIADVCDKGVGAALFMALTRSLMRVLAQQAAHRTTGRRKTLLPGATEDIPADIAEILYAVKLANEYICDNHSSAEMFATLFFAVLDTESGKLFYVNGGHDAPVVLGKEGVRERLKASGPAVGIIPEAHYKMRQIQLEPGEILLGYTDGITEARNTTGGLYSEKRLMARLSEWQTEGLAGAAELLSRIIAEVHSHVDGAEPSDDITLIGLRRLD